MHAKPVLDRIALIDECSKGDGIAKALLNAGYDVAYVRRDEPLDGEELVIRITAPGRSGIVERHRRAESASDKADREVEARRREAEKMEAIARLAGGIAHDFNNLLSVIAICTDDIFEALNPGHVSRTCLEDIRDAVERGAAVTRDLLAFSRLSVEDAQLVDLNDVVTTSRRLIERVLGEAIRVETTLTTSNVYVHIDTSQWSSVFVNLALNARCAMPLGGTLTLRTQTMVIDPAERGRDKAKGLYVELEVTDSGCGMTHEVQARIFEPFFTTKGIGKGTGLGLSVVYGIVEQSGGWIEVSSRAGAGTTFRIYLPTANEPPAVAFQPRPALVATRDVRLLVVEDEEAVRRIAIRALQRGGYHVFDAGSAEDALEMSTRIGPIDVLVTDIVLPGMNGRRLADRLLQRNPSLGVLYTSGYTDDEVVRFGVARDEVSFLQKPYSMKQLLERVEKVLARRAALVQEH